ncbi:MAG: DUF2267 domain-containing protein [Bdellovibrionota bacterium]
MTYPLEYSRAGDVFTDFLHDVKVIGDYQTRHQVYTMAQGVFQAFRRRLSLKEAIEFANVLPAGLRAFFVADWNPDEPRREFASRQEMNSEVGALRAGHNFSFMVDDPIACVAKALEKYVDQKRFRDFLATLPPAARDFWRGDRWDVSTVGQISG